MSNTFSLLLPFCGLFSVPSAESRLNCGVSTFRTCPRGNMAYYRLRENSYTRVHFNLTRRILSARIQDPATAPAAVRIPAPAPGRQAAAQDRPATPAVPDSPGPPGVAPARHARPDSPLAREAPEQAEDHAPEAGPTGRARREAGPTHQGQEAFQQIGPQGRKLRKRN